MRSAQGTPLGASMSAHFDLEDMSGNTVCTPFDANAGAIGATDTARPSSNEGCRSASCGATIMQGDQVIQG
jgi:hypothetical protein